jgi:hypothetical protein
VVTLTRNAASDIRYISSVEELSEDKTVIDIVVMELRGLADYAMEIYWKGMNELADDAVGMYLANMLQSPAIVSDDEPSPYSWLRLSPNGIIDQIDLDIEQLDENSTVLYVVG